jgi:hypothetical protein
MSAISFSREKFILPSHLQTGNSGRSASCQCP